MRIVVESLTLKSALSDVMRVQDSRATMPILEDVLLKVTDGRLTLTCSSRELWATVDVETKEADRGAACVDARSLFTGVSNIVGLLTIETIGKEFIVSYQNGRFSLPLDDEDLYPDMPKERDARVFVLDAAEVSAGMVRAMPAMAKNDTLRTYLNSVYFDFTGEQLNIVGTSGFALVISPIRFNSDVCSFILAAKAVTVLNVFLAKVRDVRIAFDSQNIFASGDGFSFIACKVDGKYPNYMSVVPADYATSYKVNGKTLRDAVRRVGVFSEERTNRVLMSFDYNTLKLSCENIDYNKRSEERISIVGSERKGICLKSTILTELLPDEDVTMFVESADRAMVFKYNGVTVLIMPIQMVV